jgi:TM2 domain-containing membrane protein YozV
VTQPTPGQPEPSGSADSPPLTGPLPTGPAYPGPPPPGYAPAPSPAAPDAGAPLKSRLTAGLLGIFLGAFGVHRFYLGYTSMGVLQVLVTIATCGIGGFWGLVEGILILSGKAITTDADGRPLRP